MVWCVVPRVVVVQFVFDVARLLPDGRWNGIHASRQLHDGESLPSSVRASGAPNATVVVHFKVPAMCCKVLHLANQVESKLQDDQVDSTPD